MVKPTVDIRDELLVQARAQAARERTTLAAMVEEGVVLSVRSTPRRGGDLSPLPVSPRRGGLRPGIDGSCNRSLLEQRTGDSGGECAGRGNPTRL